MSKVYVTQENSRLNYMDAERFGEVVFITASEYSPNPNSRRNDIIESEIRHGLINFDSDLDYLLLSGDPVIMALSFHRAASISTVANKVQLLKWDSQNRSYNEIVVQTN